MCSFSTSFVKAETANIKVLDGNYRCVKHQNQIKKTILIKDHLNNNICNAYQCRVTTNLRNMFHGWFCEHHLSQLTTIRYHIQKSKANLNYLLELDYRMQEIRFRKQHDSGHMKRVLRLERLSKKCWLDWLRPHVDGHP